MQKFSKFHVSTVDLLEKFILYPVHMLRSMQAQQFNACFLVTVTNSSFRIVFKALADTFGTYYCSLYCCRGENGTSAYVLMSEGENATRFLWIVQTDLKVCSAIIST